MATAIDVLEKNVIAAASLITSLRVTVERLSRELENRCPGTEISAAQAPSPVPESSLMDELERLRAERIVIRDGIRRLLREIDKVSW